MAVVAAPPLQPPRFGLITSARDATADPGGERWEEGLAWETESCAQAGVVAPCDDTPDKELDQDDLEGVAGFTPFIVWAGHVCSTFGGTIEQREAKARRLLAAHQHRAVETEFWKGTAAQAENWDNAYLAGPDTTVLSPGDSSSPLVYALAALEEAVAGCGGRSMIHVSVPTATLLVAAQAVRREGGLLLTGLDNIVVPGSGYDGSSPDGDIDATGATAWAYATGMVDVRLGGVVVLQGVEQRQNLIEVRAERAAAAIFDPCCVFGINVNLCETFCDPG